MNTYQLEVVEPSALPILEDLEERKLIRMRPSDPRQEFGELVKKIRTRAEPLTLEEITAEVEAVRSSRFARRNENQGHN